MSSQATRAVVPAVEVSPDPYRDLPIGADGPSYGGLEDPYASISAQYDPYERFRS